MELWSGPDSYSNWFSLGQLRLQDVQDSSQNSSLLLTPIPHQQVGGVSPAARPQQRLLQTLSCRSGGGAGPRLILNTHETHIDLLSILILCSCFIYIFLNALKHTFRATFISIICVSSQTSSFRCSVELALFFRINLISFSLRLQNSWSSRRSSYKSSSSNDS